MTESIQDIYGNNDENGAYISIRKWLATIDDIDTRFPPYGASTRLRDKYLLAMSRSEPILSGVLSTVVSRDKNRAWSLVGGKRIVSKYGNAFHSLNGGEGWRNFIGQLSTSYYGTNLGYAAEIGSNRIGVPETMWSFDPTKLSLVGGDGDDKNNTLYYYGDDGQIGLKRIDYIHGNSMASVEDDMRGAGFCAIERALSVAKIMMALFKYQSEKLSSAPSKGVLLFKEITYDEFLQATSMADEQASNEAYTYYKGLLALFASSGNAEINLTAFSELPDNFELEKFVNLIVQTYSLAFGYSVGEFWAIESGSFGRTGEMKVQEQMSTAKGELEFALSLQEQIQTYFIPPNLSFQFDVRNDSGDLVKQTVIEKKIANIVALYEATGSDSVVDEEGMEQASTTGLITREEGRQMLVDDGVIPQEWTAEVEEDEEKELTELRYNCKHDLTVLRQAIRNPDEPIIRYTSSPLDLFERGTRIARVDQLSPDTIESLSRSYLPSGTISVLYEKGSDLYNKNY